MALAIDITLAEFVSLLLQACVAFATGAVALMLLAAGPRRTWNQWLAFFLLLVCGNFAAEAVQQGAHYMARAGFLDVAQSQATEAIAGRLKRVFAILDPFALAYFASVFPRRTLLATRSWGPLLLGAPAVAFLAAEVFFSHLSRTGPENLDLVRVGLYAYMASCYLFACWRLLGSYLFESSAIMAEQVRWVTLGVLIAMLSRVALLWSDPPGTAALAWLKPWEHAAEVLLRVATLWALLFLVAWWVRRAPGLEVRRGEAQRLMRLVGFAFAGFTVLWLLGRLPPAILYAFEDSSATTSFGFQLNGAVSYTVRWLVFCGAMVVGMLRYETLAVNPSAMEVSLVGIGTAGAFVIVGLAAGFGDPWLAAAAGAAIMTGTFVGVRRLGRVGATRARGGNYLHLRGLEVYRALLASSLASGGAGGTPTAHIEEARVRLGISKREHESLLAIARAEEPGHEPQKVLLGRYEFMRRLGAGGYATVHLARDRATGSLVALKHIRVDRAGERAAFDASLRELEVARRVSHPNLVPVHDLVRVDDGAVVVMDYAVGGALRDRMAEQGRVAPGEAAGILRDCLAGLAALHGAGIVHGDLKPENILLTEDGRALLADFGAARATEWEQTLVHGSQPARAMGTLLYLAPEQARGEAASPQSDIYALGAVAFEMLAGMPYVRAEGKGPYDVLRELVEGTGARLSEVDPAWREFLARALAPRPEERFASAQEMLGSLELLEERPAPPGGAAPRLPTWRRRWTGG